MHHSADLIQQCDVRLEGNDLLIRAPKTMLLFLKTDADIQRVAVQVAGKPVRVRVEAGENITAAPVASSGPTTQDSELRERALSHPGVKRFQELFPDAQVRTVRNLNE